MTDKIQFACPHCSSTLAVAVAHAGKAAKCPVCGETATVPQPGGPWDAGLAPTTPVPVTPRSASSPFGPAESASAPFSDGTIPQGSRFDELESVGARPADGGGYSFEQPDPPRTTSMGRSIGGLIAAMGVGLAAMLVWLVLAAMSGYELGILAWAIGGLIGLVAGVIAKNPSPVYCSLVALIAMGAILSAKLAMALAIVALHFITSVSATMEAVSSLVLPDKYTHAYVDQTLADNLYTGEQKLLAIRYNGEYFESSEEDDAQAEAGGEVGGDDLEIPAEWEDDADDPGLRDFYRDIHEKVTAATEQEKAAWLANAHQRHPTWIEDYSHFQAAVIELAEQPGQLDAELTAHARYTLPLLVNDGSTYESEYADSITPAEFVRRKRQLSLKCAELLRGKSRAEIEALLGQGMQKYPAFTPFPDAFTATLDKMMLDGSLEPALQSHAKLYLDTELGPADEMAYYDAEPTPEFAAFDTAMRQAVNVRLATMDETARNAAVRETGVRHPNWYVVEEDVELPEMPELGEDLGDGTFVGSLKMVFGVYDLLWLFLGATTAYGTARRRAKKG